MYFRENISNFKAYYEIPIFCNFFNAHIFSFNSGLTATAAYFIRCELAIIVTLAPTTAIAVATNI